MTRPKKSKARGERAQQKQQRKPHYKNRPRESRKKSRFQQHRLELASLLIHLHSPLLLAQQQSTWGLFESLLADYVCVRYGGGAA